MFCQRCGQQIKNDSNYCPACGAKIGEPLAPGGSARWDAQGGWQPPQSFSDSNTGKLNKFGLAALVCGLLGALFFWMIVPGFVLGTIAVIFGMIALLRLQNRKGQAIAGLVLGIAALALAIWMIAAVMGDSSWYLNDLQTELNYI